VQVAAVANPEAWRPVSNGDQVRTGQRLRTGPGSTVTMIFFDGSRSTLAAESEVALERIDGGWGKVLQVRIVQATGSTAHSIVPFGEKQKGSYIVMTPSGKRQRAWNFFQGAVDRSGEALFRVDSGIVRSTMLARKCRYLPGKLWLLKPENPCPSPIIFSLSRLPEGA